KSQPPQHHPGHLHIARAHIHQTARRSRTALPHAECSAEELDLHVAIGYATSPELFIYEEDGGINKLAGSFPGVLVSGVFRQHGVEYARKSAARMKKGYRHARAEHRGNEHVTGGDN